MKKSILYSLVILLILFIIGLLSLKNGKIGVTDIMAYDPAYATCGNLTPYFIYFGPNLVNAMEGQPPMTCGWPVPAWITGPPKDSSSDLNAWKGYAPGIVPTPQLGGGNSAALYNPTGGNFGLSYLKVTWTGTSIGSVQKAYLAGTYFENVGSDAADTFNSRTDWTKYAFIRFVLYCNEYGQFGSSTGLSQTFTLWDGAMSKTVGPVQFVTQWAEPFVYHMTASLNFLMNSDGRVNTWNATYSYFNVSSVAGFYIDAPAAPYMDSTTPGKLNVYYDWLTLGARTDIGATTYGAPSNGKVETAIGTNPGAWIRWDFLPQPTTITGMPITGYHVFRSESVTKSASVRWSGHPYVSVGIYDSLTNSVVDTACPGVNTYCYKVLILNNGPSNPLNVAVERARTINATYNESLLDDVGEICGWVDKVPTPTPTPPTTPPGTPTPTSTIWLQGFENAHVYPNPFNPNAGSKQLYVNNVQPGTKVTIFAMDGALVKELKDVPSIAGTFIWDGTNNNGSKVVSGLYYLVLQYKGKTKVERVIVCYKCDPVYKKKP